MLDPVSVAAGAAIVPLIWVGSKLFGSLRNHAHRDRGVRGLKVSNVIIFRSVPLSCQTLELVNAPHQPP
jgi:hypothetical protein